MGGVGVGGCVGGVGVGVCNNINFVFELLTSFSVTIVSK